MRKAAKKKQGKYNFKFKPPAKIIKPNIIHVSKKQWIDNKKRMFQWADNQAAQHGLSGNKVNTLKTIIANTNEKGVTFVTLPTIRKKLIERYGKAAPSKSTIERYVAEFVALKLIKRSAQERAKTLVKTRLLMGKLASCSASKRGAEYISTQRYIYTGKATSNPVAAFPSTSNHNFQNQSHNEPSAPPLNAAALGSCDSRQGRQTKEAKAKPQSPPIQAPSYEPEPGWKDDALSEGAKFFKAWRESRGRI